MVEEEIVIDGMYLIGFLPILGFALLGFVLKIILICRDVQKNSFKDEGE